MYFFQEKPSRGNMAVIDLVLGIFKVVTFVYDIVTFPIYGMTLVNWTERTRQNLGNVSYCYPLIIIFDNGIFEALLHIDNVSIRISCFKHWLLEQQ